MEITTEIKKAVAYQYYGQKYVYKNEFGTYSEVIGGFHTNTHIQYDSFKLKLKPLSAITDADAIQVARIYGLYNDVRVSRTGDAYGNFNEHRDSVLVIQDKPNYWCIRIPKKWENKSELGLNVYQYLISKGYDMPQHLLEGKNLEEAGLAIYTK